MANSKRTPSAHAPLPWSIRAGSDHRFFQIVDPQGCELATVCGSTPDETETNARFIVTACNAHAELLEGCELAADLLSDQIFESLYDDWESHLAAFESEVETLNDLTALIAKVKGEPPPDPITKDSFKDEENAI